MLITIIILAVIAVIAIAIFAGKRPAKSSPHTSSEPAHEQVIADANRLLLLAEVMRQAEARGDNDTVQAVKNMTYSGPLPKQRPDGSFSCVYELQDYNIAGINYREGIAAYIGDFYGYLQPDPNNEHDPNAIAVYAQDGHHLGFIPAGCTDFIHSLGKPFPMPVTGTIEQEHDELEHRDYFVGTVYFYTLKK